MDGFDGSVFGSILLFTDGFVGVLVVVAALGDLLDVFVLLVVLFGIVE